MSKELAVPWKINPIDFEEIRHFKEAKDLRASRLGFTRPSVIQRTRKRQIKRAKFMLEEYEAHVYEEYERYPMCEVCGREKSEGIYNGMYMCGECAYEQAYYDTFGRR